MNIHFNSGAIIDHSTTAATGDEIDVPAGLALALIAQGIAYSLEPEETKPADTAIAELVDTDGTMAGNSDAAIPSQKAAKSYVDTAVATAVHKTGDESIAGKKTFSGNVLLTALPTSDPGVAGELWNSTGTVKVSAGS
jgi:hypothetical protein